MRRNLKIDDLGDLLERPILAVLATRRKNGEILLSPVCHEWADGRFSFTVWTNDIKSRHIKNDPRVTMLVADTEHPLRGIQVTGEATLDPQADAVGLMRRLGERYGTEVGQDDFAGAYESDALEVVRLAPDVIRA
jgi:PPOX class probable F420-dependent enzyme